MPVRRAAPSEIAFWRYQQIEEALDEGLSASERGPLLRRLSRTPVRWPSGRMGPVSAATLYRWLNRYRTGGLEALRPKPRVHPVRRSQHLADEVVQEALVRLSQAPELTYTFLAAVLQAEFPEHIIKRSTLQRRVKAHPRYAEVRRARAQQRRRRRFVAQAAHDIWQTDAKGPVSVVLTHGERLRFHILSILDDATRAVLAAIVVLTVNLAAAVRVFRTAAQRWGLPRKLYADRASIFDSTPFRKGLAQLGSYRIWTRPRGPEARGKIEAYHRVLVSWFTGPLRHQQVVDLCHLQQLLDGVIHSLYQHHRHRGLRGSPHDALAGEVSSRQVPPAQLYEAFRQSKRLKAHRKTGEVDLHQTTYLVPDELRGQRLTFLIDPEGEVAPRVLHPDSGAEMPLRRAAITPADLDLSATTEEPHRWAEGPLQTIYDHWQGQVRPVAEPGFGVPEVYALLSTVAGRHVPRSEAEAAAVARVYRELGPWARQATEAALQTMARELGPGRPIQTYLDALRARVGADTTRRGGSGGLLR